MQGIVDEWRYWMEESVERCIETENLVLMPMTYEFVDKLIEKDDSAYDLYALKRVSDWPNEDTAGILPIIKKKLSENEGSGYTSWLYIEKASRTIVGDGGFKGKPDSEGKIDLGYGVIESKRGMGYATEAARALLNWGLDQAEVKAVTADCLMTNVASFKVLSRIGMIKIKEDETHFFFCKRCDD